MRLTERHRPCRFPAYPTRFRRSREEGDFDKGRGRTNTEAGNRGHQDQRHRGSSRRIARHRFGKAFQVSAGTSAARNRASECLMLNTAGCTRQSACAVLGTDYRLSKFQFHLCRFSPERIFPPAVYERAHRRYAEREIMEYRSLTALCLFLTSQARKARPCTSRPPD
jgi:hypothetical protein